MDRNQRNILSELRIRTLKRMEAKHIPLIYAALQAQIKAFTAYLSAHGVDNARHQIDKVLLNHHLVKPIENLYREFGLWQAKKTIREINGSVRVRPLETKAGFGINEELLNAIIAYLRQFILNRAVIPITKTTRDQILAMLIKGEQEGWGVDKIVYELDNDELTKSRARTIVRTESLKAMQYGQQAASAQSRWQTEGEWIAAHDHRTRHSHRDVDGKKKDEGKRFAVPIYKKNIIAGYDMMLGPGDPTASAGNVINCRCSLATIAKRDSNGRLIPKKVGNSGISVILPEQRFIPHTVITV